MPKKQAGFTLIELMVTIVIVAILSGVGFTVYAQSQKVARDDRRKLDIKVFQTGLELYYSKHGYYPSFNTSTQGDSNILKVGCAGTTQWMELFQWGYDSAATGNQVHYSAEKTSDYMASIPLDPVNNCTYHYNYAPKPPTGPNAGQDYLICVTLENTSDPGYNPGFWGPIPPCLGHNYGIYSPFH